VKEAEIKQPVEPTSIVEEPDENSWSESIVAPKDPIEPEETKGQTKLEIKDSLIVFVQDELVLFRFDQSSGWRVGDTTNNFQIPKFSSFTKITDDMFKTDLVDGFITGGVQYGFS
jgi:hypothetical protein